MISALIAMCASISRIMALFTYDLRYQSLNALLYYDQKYFDRPESSPGSLSYKLGNDCEKVSSLGGPALGLQLFFIVSIVGGIVLSLVYDVIYTFVILSFTPLIILSLAQNFQLTTDGLSSNDIKKTALITSDALSNIKTVYSLNSQKYFHKEYMIHTNEDRKNIIKLSHISGCTLEGDLL